jgi:DNA-binding response OmpR family regulator
VMTALVHLTEQIQGFEEGAVEYLTKPSQPSVIVERVRTLLSLSQEQRLLLQRKRMEEQRNTLRRLNAAQPEEFVW